MEKQCRGNVKSIIESNYGHSITTEVTLNWRSYFKFDKYQNVIEYKQIGRNGFLNEEYTAEIDDYGNIEQITGFRRDGVKYRIVFMYYNNITLGYNEFYNGLFEKTILYNYNNKGYLKKAYTFISNGELVFYEKNKYDENGRNINTICQYSESKKTINRIFNSQGDSEFTNSYSLGHNHSEKIFFSYEYDNKGNWIVKKMSDNDRYNIVLKREIEYY